MQQTYKISLFLIALFITGSLSSQNNTSSPYSQFGVGDLTNKNFGWSSAMGGMGYGLRSSQHINFKNPASYTSIDSMSFVFAFGVKSKITKYKTLSDEITNDNTNLSFISIGFPITKWLKSSIGLIPYSYIGYTIKDTLSNNLYGNYTTYNFGKGGINEFYIGNSIELFKKLSLGFNISYLFGTMEQIRSLFFDESSEYLATQRQDIIRLNDLHINCGVQYYNKINDKIKYTIALTFESKNKVKASYESLTVTTRSTSAFYNEINESHVEAIINHVYEENDQILLPNSLGFGFTLNFDEKLTVGGDYSFQSWSNSRILGKTDSLVNSNSFCLGMEYTPGRKSLTKYYKRVNYRLGGHYTNSYIQLFDEQIKDFGVSFGFGLPIKRTNSLVNLSFDLGKRGTTDNNLILENYGIISLNVSLSDIWFVKRKFD